MKHVSVVSVLVYECEINLIDWKDGTQCGVSLICLYIKSKYSFIWQVRIYVLLIISLPSCLVVGLFVFLFIFK